MNRPRIVRVVAVGCWLVCAFGAYHGIAARQVPRDAAARPAPPAGTSRISGQVVAADSGAPVKRAAVNISSRGVPPQSIQGAPAGGRAMVQMGVVGSFAGGGPFPPQVTDDAGRFEFGDLPAGLYAIMVAPRTGFVRTNSPQQIEVGDGKTASIVIKLERTGVITGRLLDESGDPIPRARVQANRRDRFAGRLLPAGTSNMTDDLGQFRIFDLPPGEYIVSGADSTYAPVNVEGPTQGYAPTYFPGSPSLDGARIIVVKSGQETSGIEFSLAKVGMGRITGTLRDSSGQVVGGRGSVSVARRGDDYSLGFNRGAGIRPDGSFVVTEIPPGEYYLVGSIQIGEGPAATREGVYVPVSVNGAEQTVDLQTNKGATVRGRVVLEGTPPPMPDGLSPLRPEMMRIMVSVRQTVTGGGLGMVSGMARPATAAEDGTFELTGIRGPVVLLATGARAALKSVSSGADDLTAQSIEFKGTERLSNVTIVMTYDVGSIEGHITDERGEALPGAAVVIFPEEDEARWFQGSPFVHIARAAPAMAPTIAPARSATPGMPPRGPRPFVPGSFTSSGLLPGRYLVAAFRSDMMPMPGREMLERLRKHATTVTVTAGTPAPVTVRAIRDY